MLPGTFAGDTVLNATNLTNPGDVTSAFEATISVNGQIQQTAAVNLSTSQVLFVIQPGTVTTFTNTNIGNPAWNAFTDSLGSICFLRNSGQGYTASAKLTIKPGNTFRIWGQCATYGPSGWTEIQLVHGDLEPGNNNQQNAIQFQSTGIFTGGTYRLIGYR